MWVLIDGSPRRGETLRSAWKRAAAIIRPINGDAHGNVRETLRRDNEKGRSGAWLGQDGVRARFIHQERRERGGAEKRFVSGKVEKCLRWSRWNAAGAAGLICIFG